MEKTCIKNSRCHRPRISSISIHINPILIKQNVNLEENEINLFFNIEEN